MIEYSIGESVRAFTAGKGDALPYHVIQVQQVHGYKTAVIDRPGMSPQELEGYDALITNLRGCAIGVRTADCVPILLYDPIHSVIGAVHAGWKGTLVRIVQKTLFQMKTTYGSQPADIKAVLGPGICSNCFQVGEEVVEAFKATGFSLDGIYSWKGGKEEGKIDTGHHIDLFEANKGSMLEYGILEKNIQISGICCYENESMFSARRDGFDCGRNISAIVLL